MPPRARAPKPPQTDPAPPDATIAARMSLAMADVGAVRKDSAVTSGPARFNFRGVDDVVNAVSPAFRRHGIVVVPKVLSIEHTATATSKGSAVNNAYVTVRYRFHGAAGDHIDAVVAAESFDSGDKATAKAMSVAYRTALLQALCLPTDEPTDPDQHTYERGPTGGFERVEPQRPEQAPPRPTVAESRARAGATPTPATPGTVKTLPPATAYAYRQRIIDAVHATAPGDARDTRLRAIHADLRTIDGALVTLVEVPEPWRANGVETATLGDFISLVRGARTRADTPAVDPDSDQWATPPQDGEQA